MVRAQVQDLVTAQPVMTPLWAAPEVSGRCFWTSCTAVIRRPLLLLLLPAQAAPRRPRQGAPHGVRDGWRGCRAAQVVRHERASIKADIWSYGILIWELISGQDITAMQPLAISRQAQRKVRPAAGVQVGRTPCGRAGPCLQPRRSPGAPPRGPCLTSCGPTGELACAGRRAHAQRQAHADAAGHGAAHRRAPVPGVHGDRPREAADRGQGRGVAAQRMTCARSHVHCHSSRRLGHAAEGSLSGPPCPQMEIPLAALWDCPCCSSAARPAGRGTCFARESGAVVGGGGRLGPYGLGAGRRCRAA